MKPVGPTQQQILIDRANAKAARKALQAIMRAAGADARAIRLANKALRAQQRANNPNL